jgi:hypothetical protein
LPLSPFQRDLGTEHGRIAVTDAPGGSYVFELGHAGREYGEFNVGDVIEVSQSGIEFDGQTALARVNVDIEPPLELPTSPAVEWEFSVKLNSATWYTRRIGVDQRSLSLSDIAISTTAAIAGPNNTLAFRLELVSA